jgi:hypothetical protein
MVVAVGYSLLTSTTPRAPFYLGGIQVNEADHQRWFDALEQAGMNTVAATVYAKQGDWDSDNLWWEEKEDAVIAEIRGAKERGLHVVLILRVALDHAFPRNEFLWHGMIMPANDTLLNNWFERYGRFVRKWAETAEVEGVDVLGIGSEMNSLASTIQVDSIPVLEEYYLNEEKQARRKKLILRYQSELAPRHLTTRGDRVFDSIDSFLATQTETWQTWAGHLTQSSEENAVERINRRRRRLESSWREIIREARDVYRGKLTFAANFDQFHEVSFWDDLDIIGINAYFELRNLDDVSENETLYSQLDTGWQDTLSGIRSFRDQNGFSDKPVLFTEIGYTYRLNSTVHPWAGDGFSLLEEDGVGRVVIWGDQPQDFTERATAMRALHSAKSQLDKQIKSEHRDGEAQLLAGLLYWKLSTEPAHHEIEPFVHILNSDNDLLGAELRRFGADETWGSRLVSILSGR